MSESFENTVSEALIDIIKNRKIIIDSHNNHIINALYDIDNEINEAQNHYNESVVQFNRSVKMTIRTGLPFFGNFKLKQQICIKRII